MAQVSGRGIFVPPPRHATRRGAWPATAPAACVRAAAPAAKVRATATVARAARAATRRRTARRTAVLGRGGDGVPKPPF